MPGGTVVDRSWIVLLDDGTPAVDWGDGTAQNIITGEFIPCTGGAASYPVSTDELKRMARAGLIAVATEKRVELKPLPERNIKTLA